jgi:hypothetical protein
MFKDSVPTAKKTTLLLYKGQLFSAVYSKNHTKLISTLRGQNAELQIVRSGGTYSYLWDLKS